LCLDRALIGRTRTRTRTNTSPYDTKAIAVGRRADRCGCTCGAQKARARLGGVGKTTHTYTQHTSATRHPRLPIPPHRALTFCAPHAHPLLSTVMAFVSYGSVLVLVRVRAANCGGGLDDEAGTMHMGQARCTGGKHGNQGPGKKSHTEKAPDTTQRRACLTQLSVLVSDLSTMTEGMKYRRVGRRIKMVKLLVSFLRLAGQRARRMPRWAPEWGASLSRREGLRLPSRATTRIESGLGASFGAHSRQPSPSSSGQARVAHVCVVFETSWVWSRPHF
jgi:hypothetical protein